MSKLRFVVIGLILATE